MSEWNYDGRQLGPDPDERKHDRICRNAATILAGMEACPEGCKPSSVVAVESALAIEAEVERRLEATDD